MHVGQERDNLSLELGIIYYNVGEEQFILIYIEAICGTMCSR